MLAKTGIDVYPTIIRTWTSCRLEFQLLPQPILNPTSMSLSATYNDKCQ